MSGVENGFLASWLDYDHEPRPQRRRRQFPGEDNDPNPRAKVCRTAFVDGKEMLIVVLGGRYGNENRADIPKHWQKFRPQYFGRVPG
jgi:hypothetical protein